MKLTGKMKIPKLHFCQNITHWRFREILETGKFFKNIGVGPTKLPMEFSKIGFDNFQTLLRLQVFQK